MMSDQKENIVRMRKKLDAHVEHVRRLERRIHDLRDRLAKYEDAEGRPKTAKWEYCPECGSEQIHYEEGDHKQCADCYQEWFADMDYSHVVRVHLGGKYQDKAAVIERLNDELAALKAQPSGVVLPPSPYLPGVDPAQLSDYERGEAQGRCDMWAEVARLNSSPVSSAPSHGEQVQAGWKLVPVEPTDEMLAATIVGGKMENRADLRPMIYRAMLAAAPAAVSQEKGE
jgi:hypothetical protein